jgi:hypothetical protein
MAVIRRTFKCALTFQGHCWFFNVYTRTLFYLTTRMHTSYRIFCMTTGFARRFVGLPPARSTRFGSVYLLNLLLGVCSPCIKKMPENTDVAKASEDPVALGPRVSAVRRTRRTLKFFLGCFGLVCVFWKNSVFLIPVMNSGRYVGNNYVWWGDCGVKRRTTSFLRHYWKCFPWPCRHAFYLKIILHCTSKFCRESERTGSE